ncbi:MAG: ATP-binding protein [Hafnia sp.]|uniref:AAA family ATPase n=1 Tax=Hafnia sp. TaxID=1873498 RepID=UPI002FCC70B8
MRQQYRLESITLRDVGVFEHTHFDFPQIKSEEKDAEKAEIHIFTGPNGCGKSTLLYALAAVFEGHFTGQSPIVKRFRSSQGRINYLFNEEQGSYIGRHFDEDFVGTDYSVWIGSNHEVIKERHHSIRNFTSDKMITFPFSVFAYSGYQHSHVQNKIDISQDIELSPFENSLSFFNPVNTEGFLNWVARNRMKSVLSSINDASNVALLYDGAITKVRGFLKDICDLDIDFKLQVQSLDIEMLIGDEQVSFEVLPDGLKSIISWVADLARRLDAIPWQENRDIFSQPIILFLDEVDIHLHPKWQRRILPAIQRLLPNAQVFVSTHSPFVVGSVEDAFVYRLPDPQRTVCRDPASAEVITPTPSAAGKSYQLILDEVFGIEEQFDVETEALLEKFYQLKKAYLSNPQDDSQLVALAAELSSKGSEVATIVSMELRQITRLAKKG